jgi:hypothetical protein
MGRAVGATENRVKGSLFARMQGSGVGTRRGLSALSGIVLAAQVALLQNPAFARTMDGFFAYCTSNNGGTGECINEEDGRKMTCMIVPGQIITCPAVSSSFECVWISGITANQAQFWCDPEDEAALYGAATDQALPRVLDDPLERGSDAMNNGEIPIEESFENEF